MISSERSQRSGAPSNRPMREKVPHRFAGQQRFRLRV
jgi:hypothetical protein